ncbi:MAG: hypothetical protein ACOCZ6_04025 [Nanoarchaeota archaeon]
MSQIKDKLSRLRDKNLAETRRKIRENVGNEQLIIQATNCLLELNKTANTISKRIREWYALYCPEAVREIPENEQLCREITQKSKQELMKTYGKNKEPMGAYLDKNDVVHIKNLAKLARENYDAVESQKNYIEELVQKTCPNVYELTKGLIGAQLIDHAGSLKNLATMPASKLQLLGAEKALFRHLRTGARSPKHGLLIQHQYVSQAKQKGKAARLLADKISIAARMDYFKGQFIGDKLKEELEKKLK